MVAFLSVRILAKHPSSRKEIMMICWYDLIILCVCVSMNNEVVSEIFEWTVAVKQEVYTPHAMDLELSQLMYRVPLVEMSTKHEITSTSFKYMEHFTHNRPQVFKCYLCDPAFLRFLSLHCSLKLVGQKTIIHS